MHEAYDDLSITSFIKIQRLKWLRHVLRMEDSRTVKTLDKILLVACDLEGGLGVGGETLS